MTTVNMNEAPENAARTEPLRDKEVAHLKNQLALGRPSRRAVAGVGFGCLGLGVLVGAIMAASGELPGALLFPALLTPTGAIFLWLAARARRTIELDLANGSATVFESTVGTKREMSLPRGTAYSLQMEGRDVFVNATTYAKIKRGDRVRVRKAPQSGIALSTELVDAEPSIQESDNKQ
jgi:hypothetical protein